MGRIDILVYMEEYKNQELNKVIQEIYETSKDAEDKLIKDFSNVYLKQYSENGLFGKEVEIFNIKSIEPYCYNTDFEIEYTINGIRLSFNGINTNLRDLNSDANNLMSEQDLRRCTVIDKESYDTYIEAYNSLNTKIEKILES